MTPAQQRCLDAIERLSVDGVPPSFEELRLHLGLGSKAGVHRLVHALAERGYINITAARKRSIQLVTREAESVPFDRMAHAAFFHVQARLATGLTVSPATIRGALVESFKRELAGVAA